MATSVCNYTCGGGKEQIYDFPKLTAIISKLHHEFENYKYTVYRCAAKFVALQKIFFTSNIPYKLVLAVMERHGIRDGDVNLMVPPFQLTSLIHDVYYACEKLGHFTKLPLYSLESATAILSNFFWNIYDPHRRHSISLLEIKITFLLLCKLYASDQMIPEFYNLLHHKKTKSVPKLNFEYLLIILSKIFSYIGEGTAYGAQNITLVMDQCYARCHNTSGLTDYQFHSLWTTTQTRFLIYANLMALIKRIEDTEKLIHLNVCASCNVDKITGIRFKCQSCKDLSLCLKCFATGYSTNKHVVGHKMYEVFTEDLPTKKFSHYFAKLCTVFFCNSEKSNEEESKGFCNINDTVVHNDTELVTIATNRTSNASTVSVKAAAATAVANLNHSQSPNKKIQSSNIQKIDSSLSCLTTTASTALNVSGKLQIIIDKLLHQNEKLELQLKCVQTSTQDELSRFLSDHQQFLMDIITEMRNFSQHTSTTEAISSFPTSSTPNRSNFAKTSTDLDNFSAVLNPQTNTIAINHIRLLNTPKDNLTHSINGADINRSYLDANKSDYSINDLSLWFNQKRSSSSMPPSLTSHPQTLGVLTEVSSQDELNFHDKVDDVVLTMHTRETEMTNFKLLLHKVKEIVEDSYSDNTELSEATQNLENVLDSIIKTEEGRRKSLN
ncbi:dystrobrevin beta isoform X1 [Lucilia cuprina]|uniref:dystrobrevin beta isoform X1 n=1 Tax=Lucilia cuprina TaxID=7375 RepID=UPI001F05EEA0|nr:dystrobrevin beta isoform X1 [Lucilia cuprina]